MRDPRHSALPVGVGEVLQRTELAFYQASLRGLGFLRVSRGEAFSAESIGSLLIAPLKGGLGILCLMVLSVSCGVHIFSLPHKREFSVSWARGSHIPRYPLPSLRRLEPFFT